MATSIGSLNVRLGLESAQFDARIKRARSEVQRFGIASQATSQKTQRYAASLQRAEQQTGRFRGVTSLANASVLKLGAGFAALLSARAVIGMFSRLTHEIDQLAKTADKLGIATDRLAGLRMAAELSGVEVSTFDMALQRMVRRLAEAAQGLGEAKGAIKELGLDARQLASVEPDEAIRQIADAMALVKNESDRVRLAFKLFDSEGVALVNTLALGRAELDKIQQQAEAAGIAVNRATAREFELFNDWFTRLKATASGFGGELSKIFISVINSLRGEGVIVEGLIANLEGREGSISQGLAVSAGLAGPAGSSETLGNENIAEFAREAAEREAERNRIQEERIAHFKEEFRELGRNSDRHEQAMKMERERFRMEVERSNEEQRRRIAEEKATRERVALIEEENAALEKQIAQFGLSPQQKVLDDLRQRIEENPFGPVAEELKRQVELQEKLIALEEERARMEAAESAEQEEIEQKRRADLEAAISSGGAEFAGSPGAVVRGSSAAVAAEARAFNKANSPEMKQLKVAEKQLVEQEKQTAQLEMIHLGLTPTIVAF